MRNTVNILLFGNKQSLLWWFFVPFYKFFLWLYIVFFSLMYNYSDAKTATTLSSILILIHFILSFSFWIKDRISYSNPNNLINAIYTKKYIKKARKFLKISDWGIVDNLQISTSSKIEVKLEDFADCEDWMAEEDIKSLVENYRIIKNLYTICNKKSNIVFAIYRTGIKIISGETDYWIDDDTKKYKADYDGLTNTLSITKQYSCGYTTTSETGEFLKFKKEIISLGKRRVLATAIVLKLISTNNHKKNGYGFRVEIKEEKILSKANIGSRDTKRIYVKISRRYKGDYCYY